MILFVDYSFDTGIFTYNYDVTIAGILNKLLFKIVFHNAFNILNE